MSRLDELIAEMCPDGVEYKTLGEVATISRGGNFQKKDYVENGVPCIHYGQIYTRYGLFVDETISFISDEKAKKQKFAKPNDVIMAVTSENVDDVCTSIAWLGNEDVAVSGHTAIIHHTLDPKFMVYFLRSEHFYKQKLKLVHGTKVIEVTPDHLARVVLPVPPLEVQREIVRILDDFTEATDELTAKLTAELTARKKQYEYYRNELLSRTDNKVSLSDIELKHCSGATPKKGNKAFYEKGNVPWLRTQEVVFNEIYETECSITEYAVEKTGTKWIPSNCVIVAISGASAGRCAINKIPLTTNQHCLNIEIDKKKALYKYVFYCVSNQFDELVEKREGARGDLNASRILGLKIPLPSLSEQKKIVDVLDKLNNLTNDISSGLPAEIAARQKQYEYYRDKLLSFKELNA